jgi:hypothetical protein
MHLTVCYHAECVSLCCWEMKDAFDVSWRKSITIRILLQNLHKQQYLELLYLRRPALIYATNICCGQIPYFKRQPLMFVDYTDVGQTRTRDKDSDSDSACFCYEAFLRRGVRGFSVPIQGCIGLLQLGIMKVNDCV